MVAPHCECAKFYPIVYFKSNFILGKFCLNLITGAYQKGLGMKAFLGNKGHLRITISWGYGLKCLLLWAPQSCSGMCSKVVTYGLEEAPSDSLYDGSAGKPGNPILQREGHTGMRILGMIAEHGNLQRNPGPGLWVTSFLTTHSQLGPEIQPPVDGTTETPLLYLMSATLDHKGGLSPLRILQKKAEVPPHGWPHGV